MQTLPGRSTAAKDFPFYSASLIWTVYSIQMNRIAIIPSCANSGRSLQLSYRRIKLLKSTFATAFLLSRQEFSLRRASQLNLLKRLQ